MVCLIYIVVLLYCVFRVLDYYIRTFKLQDVRHRYVLITGCDTGFGNLLARTLDKKGVPVFASCLTELGMRELREKCSSRLKAFQLDVTSNDGINRSFDFVQENIENGGQLWGVVNNAGILSVVAPVEFQSKTDYEKIIAVNLIGTIAVTTKFLPLLRKSRGRVVNMATILTMVPMANLAPYTISKSGIVAFSDTLRREMYNLGVTVHVVHPSGFKTNIFPPGLKQRCNDVYNSRLNPDQETSYKDTLEDLAICSELHGKVLDGDLTKVTDAITHALLSRFPRKRYLVGLGANSVFWIMSILPYWITDFFFQGGPFFTKMVKRLFPNKG